MTKLSVNVNKLATLRNSRGKNLPDVVAAGRDILSWGAHGLTVHPRPDGRHIRRPDVYALAAVVRESRAAGNRFAEFNVEGYPSDDFLRLIAEIRPDQATLVPDPPQALTSNAGWRVSTQAQVLRAATAALKQAGVRVSIFIDPRTARAADFADLKAMGVDRIELYTEAFADHFGQTGQNVVVEEYARAADEARAAGLGLNAGHDLNQRNLSTLVTAIPDLAEVSIGHALICEALYDGLQTTVRNYLRILGWRQ